jgi:RimJ/RimL family protein N-acetyltransferase
MNPSPDVTLADVDETVLAELLELARRDASPDEVAPPVGGSGWDLERTGWFLAYHRAAAAGLDGPAREKSWAVLCGGELAGSVRLKREGAGDVPSAETGIWLGRHFRSHGVGTAALRLVLAEARRAGIARVTARTLAGNEAARDLLAAVGGHLASDGDGTVSAVVEL